ncbi:EamA family transporter [Psychromonas sp. B3M02]|uniref:DMT family transporter n=1 Tax=Psychromonas sp. B3M02 TaxID=2267226 RepID=UPI000DE8BFE3|nr:DMT family transporter [Psychromonas sp. B3M02]RBW46336.1 EamA family transporter [Psychromonas sp. B3M02]
MRGEIHLVLATLLAGIGWIASKLVITGIPGDLFIASRFFIASFILLPFCYKSILRLNARQVWSVCGVGLMLTLGIQVWIYAVSITNSLSEGAFIMSLAMIIAPFTAWIFFRERPNRAFWIALPIAIIGMMLLTLANGWQVESSQWCFLLSSALFSVHFIFNKRVTNTVKPLVSIYLQLLTVGSVSFIYVLLTQEIEYELNNTVIFWFIVSTLIATSIRYLFQSVGQFSVKIETAALIMILEPIWTLLLSISMLGEEVKLQKLLGAAVIFLSLFIYVKLSRR